MKKNLIYKAVKVALIMGGDSSERDISLLSGKEVSKALKTLNLNVVIFDPRDELDKLAHQAKEFDIAFIALHGKGGEDGTIQKFLQKLNLPYTGSGPKASLLAFDKIAAKKIFSQNKIPIIPHQILKKGQKIVMQLDFPVVIKPSQSGSSIGVFIANNLAQMKKAIDQAWQFDKYILIEKYIKGRELTVPVLGKGKKARALPVVEIIPPKGRFFDRKNKYDGTTKEIVPAPLSPQLTKLAQSFALKCHRALGCSGLTRTDMIESQGKIYILEINTIPGLTSQSLAPKSAKAAGIDFPSLIKKIINEVHSF